MKKILCISSLETNFHNNESNPSEEVEIGEQMNILFPYLNGGQAKQIFLQKMRFKELIKVLMRYVNNGKTHEVRERIIHYLGMKIINPNFFREICVKVLND